MNPCGWGHQCRGFSSPFMPTPIGDTAIRWRNAAYAVQWWVFAAFALWLWVRMVREEARREEAPAEPLAATGDNGPRDDA